MGLLADLGDRAGAVSTYHHCASVLERELGLQPDQATRDALQGVLARIQTAVVTQPVIGAAGRSGMATATLVGRSAEFGSLRAGWHHASAGRATIAMVGGDPGVGKSRLVAELAALARTQGAVVAGTQCFGTSRRLALSPVADWLRNPAVQAATATLDPVWRVEVDRLVPTAEVHGEPGTGARAMVDAWQRHRFFEGMARALTSVGRPMLLVLDNVQWCDQETLAFLTFCLGLAPDSPMMVAGTLRTDSLDQEPALIDWLATMRAGGTLTDIVLSPLDVADTGRLAEEIAGRPLGARDGESLQALTGGFPLYVVEAARSIVDLGNPALPGGDLSAVLANRLEQVSPTVREVAGLAAATGRDFSLELLTEASDLDPDTVVRAVDELWRRRILRELGEGYDFSHDLLRDTAYGQVSPPKRWLLHRRLAQALQLLHAEDTDAVSAQLAQHYARGGRAERAVAYYRRAAEVAAVRFAHAEAIRLYTEALSVLATLPEGTARDRQELDVLEAMAAPLNARYGYSSPQLRRALDRSIVLAQAVGRKESALTALIGLWTSQFVQGDLDGGHRTVTRALTLVEPQSKLSGPAHFAYAGSAVSRGRSAEALRHFELAATLTRGAPSLSVGTRTDVHAMAWAAHAHWLLGHDDAALASCRDAIALAREIEHPYSLAVALAYGAVTFQLRNEVVEVRRQVTELRELCDRYGFAYYREWGLVLDGWSHDDDLGIPLIKRGIANLKSDGSFARMPYWLSLLADLSARCGRSDAAAATLDAALIGAHARHELWWMPELIRLRAAYDPQQTALSRLRAAAQLATEHGSAALFDRCQQALAQRGVRTPNSEIVLIV